MADLESADQRHPINNPVSPATSFNGMTSPVCAITGNFSTDYQRVRSIKVTSGPHTGKYAHIDEMTVRGAFAKPLTLGQQVTIQASELKEPAQFASLLHARRVNTP